VGRAAGLFCAERRDGDARGHTRDVTLRLARTPTYTTNTTSTTYHYHYHHLPCHGTT
jgi:hypothetical protein